MRSTIGPSLAITSPPHGADYGSVLVIMQVPRAEMGDFRRFLARLGYLWADETRNPAYRLFLG